VNNWLNCARARVCVVHSSCDDRSSKKKKEKRKKKKEKRKRKKTNDIIVEPCKKEKTISLIEKSTCHRNFKHT